MSEKALKQFVDSKIEKRFRGHEVLKSKYVPNMPESAEREYIRATNAYMMMLKEILEQELPIIKQAYAEEIARSDAQDMRFDAMTSLISIVNRTFERMENLITEKEKSYGLRKIIEDISNISGKLSIKEWKRTIRATLGIDITEDYYMGDFLRQALTEWTSENVDLIKSIPLDTLSKMKEIVLDGYKTGRTTTAMMKEIQRAYGVDKCKAKFIARDQVAKLNSQVTQAQQQDAGIEEYIWWCVNDSRSRQAHKDLHGKTCRWDTPPQVAPGRYCHPGQDYQCRCIARPIFKRRNITLPISDNDITIINTYEG